MQVTKDMLGSTGIPSFSQCHCLPFAFKANSYSSSTPGSSVHGISLARILEWVAMSYSGGSSQPRDRTVSPILMGDYCGTTREDYYSYFSLNISIYLKFV